MSIRSLNVTRIVVAMSIAMLAAFGCAHAANPGKDAQPLPSLPDSKKDCSACHVMDGPTRTDAVKKNLSALCLDCHPDRLSPSEHKVDIVPSMKVIGLPLTNGKMTCFTCHDPHANPYGGLLRVKETDLCLICHPL